MHIVLDLALSQSLIESVAQRQIVLVLGTGQELVQLVGARVLAVVLLLLWLGILLDILLLLLLLDFLVLVTAAEHASHRVSKGVSLERETDNEIINREMFA